MTAFETDIFTEILHGKPVYVQQAALIPGDQQSIPIVVAEVIIRGHMNQIRRAEANKKTDFAVAYQHFEDAISAIRAVRILSYTPAAHALAMAWKASKIKVGTHDLRIAAIAVIHGATLVTRNKRDFDQIPGLTLAVWP
jgi:tRNA(fMet)-specific endonuclease VapC